MKGITFYILFFCTMALQVQATSSLWEAPNTSIPRIISVLDSNTNPDIRVYPNPATDYIMVSENDKVDDILIYNVLGKLVKKFKTEPHKKYDITDLPKGMYVIRLLDNKSKLVKTRRITKRQP